MMPRSLHSLLPALLLGLSLTTCTAVPEAPPNTPVAAAPLPQEASVISIPVSVDLDQLAAEILRQLPKPLLTSTQKRTLPVRVSSMRTSYGLEPGTCSVTELNCLTRNSVRTLAADYTAPTEAQLQQQMFVRDLKMNMEGNQFALTAQVEFTINARFKSAVNPLGITDCADPRARPRFEIIVGGNVGWNAHGDAVINPRPYYIRWLQPCNITAFPLNVEEVLDLAALRDRLQAVAEEQVFSRLRQGALRAQLDRIWPELNAPREIRPGVWLLPRPEKVAFADLVGKGRYVSSGMLVSAHPELTKGERPALVLPPVPVPERGISSVESMHLAIRGDVPLAGVQEQLSRRLGSALIQVNGVPVRLQAVRLYGYGDRAVLALTFSEPALAEIYLLGRPVYDLEKNEVRFEALAYFPETRKYLVRMARWLISDGFLAAVQSQAVFGFDDSLAGALKGFQNFSLAAGQDMTWRGGIQHVQPQVLYFTRDSLVAYVLVEGRLALESRQK